MLRILGLVLLAVIPIVGITHGADLRGLYDKMYPVNALKRDAFNLCHEFDPTFIRAVGADRVACFGRMPHSIALAIGYVRPGTALAADRDAARLLAEAAALTRAPLRPPHPVELAAQLAVATPALATLPAARAWLAALSGIGRDLPAPMPAPAPTFSLARSPATGSARLCRIPT